MPFFNYSIVDWAKNDTIFKSLEEMSKIHFKTDTATPGLARLRGFLLKELVKNMNDKIKNKEMFDIAMYSGHEYTVFYLLDILKISEVSRKFNFK